MDFREYLAKSPEGPLSKAIKVTKCAHCGGSHDMHALVQVCSECFGNYQGGDARARTVGGNAIARERPHTEEPGTKTAGSVGPRSAGVKTGPKITVPAEPETQGQGVAGIRSGTSRTAHHEGEPATHTYLNAGRARSAKTPGPR